MRDRIRAPHCLHVNFNQRRTAIMFKMHSTYWNSLWQSWFRIGGEGDDNLQGGEGRDVILGLGGDDAISGGDGRDHLFGGDGNDTIKGGYGRDYLSGGTGDDMLDGGYGRDVLYGGDGADALSGGEGRDWLAGNASVDTLTGGSGWDTFVFDGPRFNNGAVTTTDGVRQVVNTPDVINDFNLWEDRVKIDASDFSINAGVKFFSGHAADIPENGINIIILQDTDNDANPATPFNAGAAASLIAANLDTPGAGFFVYHNSALKIDRLVYSSDLSDANADISVVANFANLAGDAGIDALKQFQAHHFDILA
jgi:Ca2+-binding RTX toxin-like protein